MGLKKDLKKIADFVDNPYEAETRPEKETIRVFVEMLIAIMVCLGFCNGFGIMAFGPLSIYPIIMILRCKTSFKELGWKMWLFWLPFIAAIVLGIVFWGTNFLYDVLGIIFKWMGFKG